MNANRQQRRQLERDNAKLPAVLTPVPPDAWPDYPPEKRPQSVWRSRHYLVQSYIEPNGIVRLSVLRTTLLPSGEWDDGLTWDELQMIKRQVGFADAFAVEVYPRDKDIVNVANLRHLWILTEPLAFAWSAQ